jgi:SRSO17 transposase
MDFLACESSESRFEAYVEGLMSVIGHADRAAPLRDYCLGLAMPGERKSVEPLAAITAPARVSAQHQSLLHFVANAAWSDAAVLGKVRELVQPAIERGGPIEAWLIDDTGFPKKGRHSVGVTRQYCGELGKQDNCQVAVTLSIANRSASLPIAYRLYLPADWASDVERRAETKIPEEIVFQTKGEIALDQIRGACRQGVPRGVVVMDAGYGNNTGLRDEISALDLRYIAGIESSTTVWAPGVQPLSPPPWPGFGRRAQRPRRAPGHQPVAVKALAFSLPKTAWRNVAWREATGGRLTSRFARLRVRAAHRDPAGARPEEWLLIEWPKNEPEPTKYWLSTLPEDISFARLVDLAKLRWRIERDYQDLKQELGLGHYEGRGWRGFHHHATLCIAAYGFLIGERAAIPPSAARAAGWLQKSTLSDGHRPRGAADPNRAPCSRLDRDHPSTSRRRSRQEALSMPVLRKTQRKATNNQAFLTQ